MVQDVGALMDAYKDSPREKRPELYLCLKGLQDRLRNAFLSHEIDKESGEAMAQYSLSGGRTGSTESRKKELFQLHFARETRPEEGALAGSHYALSTKPTPHGSLTHRFPLTTSRTIASRISKTDDKRGMMHYLKKIDVVRNARRNPAAVYFETAGPLTARASNVRYKPGEIGRQFDKSIHLLSLKKQSDIANYNQADNSVLQKEMHMMKTFVGLPQLTPSSRYASRSKLF